MTWRRRDRTVTRAGLGGKAMKSNGHLAYSLKWITWRTVRKNARQLFASTSDE